VLERLEGLRSPATLRWAVLVVDNASTDDTPAVTETFRARGRLDLRYVREATLGLTPARLRGAKETTADWIAFVDDDNLLEPGWLEAMAAAISAHPDAGGLGGRVCLQWAKQPKPCFGKFGYCFAEQELGDEPKAVQSLVGAGMVLRRGALQACGWTDGPLIADRVGKSLISGGDAEIALRVRGAGFELRYVPGAVMQHVMPAGRAEFGYLMRITWALGVSEAALGLLDWRGGYGDWSGSTADESRRRSLQARRGFWWSVRHWRQLDSAVVWLAAARGYAAGLKKVKALSQERRAALIGAAHRRIGTAAASA
jgi:glycosyltransferase involved in cell wall biosynthesis